MLDWWDLGRSVNKYHIQVFITLINLQEILLVFILNVAPKDLLLYFLGGRVYIINYSNIMQFIGYFLWEHNVGFFCKLDIKFSMYVANLKW